MKLLQDIKQCRTTFDTSETRKSFGPVVVDYAKVQSKVSLKYDSWHKDVLSKFGQLLGQEMTQFHAQVSRPLRSSSVNSYIQIFFFRESFLSIIICVYYAMMLL